MKRILLLVLLTACSGEREAVPPAPSTQKPVSAEPSAKRDVSRPEIVIDSPAAGTPITTNPLRVTGTARTFENTVVLRLKSGKGELLTETFTTSTGEAGQHNPFSADLFVTRDPGELLIVEALEYSAKDGSERSLTRVETPFSVEIVTETVYVHDPGRAPRDCSRVFPEKRSVPKSIARARLIAEVLAQTGPFPRGVQVRSAILRDQILTVDFNSVMKNVGGACRAQAIRASLETTLGRIPGVQRVVITADGSEALALQP